MRAQRRIFLYGGAAAVLFAAVWLLTGDSENIARCVEANRPPVIYPDYSGIVIPPNLAPLNLQVKEPGRKFCLKISADAGPAITVFSDDGAMRIPPDKWRALLRANAGGSVRLDLYAKGDGGWAHFDSLLNRVSAEDIDAYVVYRVIPPVFNLWQDITIRQRDLRSFDERVLFDNRRSVDPGGKTALMACVNCHTFLNHRSDKMLLHVRNGGGKTQGPAMILVQDGGATKVDTRLGSEPPAAYISWHPGGRLLAFSRNNLWQMFHTGGGVEVREVLDKDSDLSVYLVGPGKTINLPQISRPDRLETFPCWSPDGQYLYFCSAPLLWEDKKKPSLDKYDKVRYDLVRVSYDVAAGQWGQVETVISADQLGKSISLPRISPDGRFLMFCGHKYGSFPIYQPGSDLYMVDLTAIAPPADSRPAQPQTTAGAASDSHQATSLPDASSAPAPHVSGKAVAIRLDAINSDRCDSYHSWSLNSRWVIFSSKREDGLFTRLYISHVDADGQCSKPFLMPQEDPTYYGRCLLVYNVPELIDQAVTVSPAELTRAMNSATTRPIVTGATPRRDDSTSQPDEPWQAR